MNLATDSKPSRNAVASRSDNSAPLRRRRILALVTDAFGGYGGIAQYNRDFLSALSAGPQDQEITVFPRLTPNMPETLPDRVTQRQAIRDRLPYSLSAFNFARSWRPSIVFNGHLYHGPLAHSIARATGARLVSQIHGTEVWKHLPPKHRLPLEASDLILTVSRDTRARVLAKIDIAPEKVVVLNNTVAGDFLPGDRRAARARLGLTHELAVVTVARLDSREGYKGHDRIIPLLAQTGSQPRPVVYLIAGIGDDEPRLKALARKCGVEDQVRFLGKVPRADLPDLYRAADLFALPSTGEGFGISFLEAMACGTPAIGLAAGGSPDALGDGELGICVTQEQFADAFLAALRNPPADPLLSTAVHARFGFHSFQQQCTQLMGPALHARRARPTPSSK